MAKATARPSYSSSPQAVQLSIPGARRPGWPLRLLPLGLRSAYKTASKTVVTKCESAAPNASTQNNDDYVYIRAPREKMTPVDNGLTETVQHQVSQSAGPQTAAPVLHSVPPVIHFVPVQPPAPA